MAPRKTKKSAADINVIIPVNVAADILKQLQAANLISAIAQKAAPAAPCHTITDMFRSQAHGYLTLFKELKLPAAAYIKTAPMPEAVYIVKKITVYMQNAITAAFKTVSVPIGTAMQRRSF